MKHASKLLSTATLLFASLNSHAQQLPNLNFVTNDIVPSLMQSSSQVTGVALQLAGTLLASPTGVLFEQGGPVVGDLVILATNLELSPEGLLVIPSQLSSSDLISFAQGNPLLN